MGIRAAMTGLLILLATSLPGARSATGADHPGTPQPAPAGGGPSAGSPMAAQTTASAPSGSMTGATANSAPNPSPGEWPSEARDYANWD